MLDFCQKCYYYSRVPNRCCHNAVLIDSADSKVYSTLAFPGGKINLKLLAKCKMLGLRKSFKISPVIHSGYRG